MFTLFTKAVSFVKYLINDIIETVRDFFVDSFEVDTKSATSSVEEKIVLARKEVNPLPLPFDTTEQEIALIIDAINDAMATSEDKLEKIAAVEYFITAIGAPCIDFTADMTSVETIEASAGNRNQLKTLLKYKAQVDSWIANINATNSFKRSQHHHVLVAASRYYGIDKATMRDRKFKQLFDVLAERGVTCL